VTDANAARPVSAGGTGAANAADARTNLGISATNTPFTPAGNIAATNVQAALAEVDTEYNAAIATRAALAGSASQAFLVAAATVADHAVSRVFGDARYDRILTSPTALTNGATIPSTENGRFYSMALPTVQTATLPSTSGLMDGFSIVVRATGLPAGYQTSSIAGNGKNILYRNSAVATFFLIGNGEIFRFTWLSGLDQWLAECLQHPGNVSVNRGNNGTIWQIGSSSFTGLVFNTTGGSSTVFNVSSSVATLVPVAGVYASGHTALMSANAGGGVTGTAYLIGINRTTGASDSTEGYTYSSQDVSVNCATSYEISNTQMLLPGQQIGAAYTMSPTGIWIYPGNNIQSISLVSR
jgi:hypothetical protein